MKDKQDFSVLIVDDEIKITELLLYALRNLPYKVISAGSAREALDIISRSPTDVLVTDIRMPEMDGLELSRQVLQKYPSIQIIIISAHGDVNSAVEALKLGAVDFLQKPVDPKVLQLSLNSAYEKWQLQHELQLAYQSLEKEKEFLEVTLRSIGDGVIATDLNGRVTIINDLAADLTGWSVENAIGKPLTKVFHIINEKTRKVCENPVAKVLETGRIIGLANHTALIAKDGTERSIADSAAPIKDIKSNTIGTVLVFRDVTIENKINTELAKTKKLESVGILAGGIAHDFNNILTGIMGNINLSKNMISQSHEAYDFLTAAEKASKRANKLTSQLLTFSKGGEPVLEVASIYNILRESADFTLLGSSINCRINRDTDLWATKVDEGQISQVIQNLILNARQAMPEGGTIHILCENYLNHTERYDKTPIKKGAYIRIVITDEGVGINSEQIEKIFDPYFTTKQKGSGLGLAVTLAIVKKHSGHITCTSLPGKGTTFTLYLPATREVFVDKKHQLPVNVNHKGHGKVMVMDDEEMIRDLSKSILQRSGYEVLQAKDGAEVLEIYKKSIKDSTPINMVIMDLTIPGGMGGRETIKRLLEIDPKVTAIVSSGYSNDPVMANYRKYGFKGCLVKPYLKKNLIEVVARLINSSN